MDGYEKIDQYNPHTVARIAEHPNVCGIKDSSGNIPQAAHIIHLTPKTFHVMVGSASALLPAPPSITFSSTVTSRSWLRASSATSASSSGLTKRMLATVASSSSATSSAGLSMLPNARIAIFFEINAIFLPLRRISPRPIGSARMSFRIATPGPVPRG